MASTGEPLFAPHTVRLHAKRLMKRGEGKNERQQGAVGCARVAQELGLSQGIRIDLGNDQRDAADAPVRTGVGKHGHPRFDPHGLQTARFLGGQGGKRHHHTAIDQPHHGRLIRDVLDQHFRKVGPLFVQRPRDGTERFSLKSGGASNRCQAKPRVVDQTLLEALSDQAAGSQHHDLEPLHEGSTWTSVLSAWQGLQQRFRKDSTGDQLP